VFDIAHTSICAYQSIVYRCQPIAVQPANLHLRPKRAEPILNPSDDVLSADLSGWGIIKWSIQDLVTVQRRRLRTLRVYLQSRISHPHPTPQPPHNAPPSQSSDKVGVDVPADVNELDVSVMIAMPSLPRQRPSASNNDEQHDEVLNEYVLGITRLPYRHAR
jgi:hypothetical protein